MFASSQPYSQKNLGFIRVDSLKEAVEQHAEVLVVILIFFAYLAYLHYDKVLMQEVYENPRKNDFVYIDYWAIDTNSDRKFRFVPMKVLSVNEEGILFKVGNIAHSTPVSPYRHAKSDQAITLRNYYRSTPLFLTHAKVKMLFESGDIYNARRPDNIYIGGWAVIPLREL